VHCVGMTNHEAWRLVCVFCDNCDACGMFWGVWDIITAGSAGCDKTSGIVGVSVVGRGDYINGLFLFSSRFSLSLR